MRTILGCTPAIFCSLHPHSAVAWRSRPPKPTRHARAAGTAGACAAVEAPVLDGRLDDAVWQQAPGGHRTSGSVRPRPGEPASQRTEARVAVR
jgi:hypothetical protein